MWKSSETIQNLLDNKTPISVNLDRNPNNFQLYIRVGKRLWHDMISKENVYSVLRLEKIIAKMHLYMAYCCALLLETIKNTISMSNNPSKLLLFMDRGISE